MEFGLFIDWRIEHENILWFRRYLNSRLYRFPNGETKCISKIAWCWAYSRRHNKFNEAIKTEGHSICIYTTSYRKTFAIRFAFWTFGIGLHTVVNQTRHNEVLKEKKNLYSKYPPAFKIDLHIDDSPGVGLEGQRFKFRTVIINDDAPWANQILTALNMG